MAEYFSNGKDNMTKGKKCDEYTSAQVMVYLCIRTTSCLGIKKTKQKIIRERYVTICPLLIINMLFQPRLAVNSCLFIPPLLDITQSTCSQKTVSKISGEAMHRR